LLRNTPEKFDGTAEGDMASGNPDYISLTAVAKNLSDPAVLVQAWKKAHAYIRSHNWYADSLELDISSLRLHQLVSDWSKLLTTEAIEDFKPDLMRLVPAPKSHAWEMEDGWKPIKEDDADELKRIGRPMALPQASSGR